MVIEEYLEGPELSVLAFSDGYTIYPLPAAQDHKRIGEGDTGLNTGGMGAYAPAPVATPAVMQRIIKGVLQPTIDGMRREGKHPKSSLYLVVFIFPKAFLLSGYCSQGSYLQTMDPRFLNTMLDSETPRQRHSCFYSTNTLI